MAKTYTEEEYQQELAKALAEGRKPNFAGMDSDKEKENRRRGEINKLPVRYS